jgi:hypothetical protein
MKLTKKLIKDDKDWFALIDKNNLSIHTKYENLDLKEIDISKNTFALSLIENINDQKRFNYIKEQMEQHILDQKKRHLQNKDNLKKKNSYIFPHINIKTYKRIKTKNNLGTKNENEEVLKLLLKRIDKKYSMKITERLKHKPIIPKGFNLSQSPYQTQNNYNSGSLTFSTDDNFKVLNNHKEKKNKYERTYYFKKYLNQSLYKIIQKAEDEENIIKQKNNNILNLKNTYFKYFTDSNVKKISTKKIKQKLKIKENTFSYPIIDKLILKGKKNFFNEAKEKLYETYLKKIKSHEEVIKLISERHIDENDI